MKAVCISLGNPPKPNWLTLHDEYEILMISAYPGDEILFRVISHNGNIPIVVNSTQFAASDQPLPDSWVCTVRQDGVVDFGPREWLEPGFWERFFDQEPEAVEIFHREVQAMNSDESG